LQSTSMLRQSMAPTGLRCRKCSKYRSEVCKRVSEKEIAGLFRSLECVAADRRRAQGRRQLRAQVGPAANAFQPASAQRRGEGGLRRRRISPDRRPPLYKSTACRLPRSRSKHHRWRTARSEFMGQAPGSRVDGRTSPIRRPEPRSCGKSRNSRKQERLKKYFYTDCKMLVR
jgi:hypothetical protein